MERQMWIVTVVFQFIYITCVTSHPENVTGEPTDTSVGNLKYTFGPGELIPEGFILDAKRAQQSVVEANATKPSSPQFYAICQDGTGGLCVPKGDCPVGLVSKAQIDSKQPESACSLGYECCFGFPEYEKSCHLRGGSCMPISECGEAPKYRNDAECDPNKDEICCILTIL